MSFRERVFESQGVAWWVILLEGIAAIIIGILLISWPVKSLSILLRLLGILFIVKGGLGIISIFTDRDQWPYKLLMGVVAILVGLFIFAAPFGIYTILETTLVLFAGFGAIVIGVIELFRAFTGAGCGVAILGGLIALLGFILVGNLGYSQNIFPFLLGGVAIVGGIAAVVMAFSMRSQAQG
jgi:uncharacterized membrane protein HdeD (DUF308 family)